VIQRLDNKLLLTPKSFKPSDARLRVIGVFNPGVMRFEDKIIMLARVAETAAEEKPGLVSSPRALYTNHQHKIEIDYYPAAPDQHDPRRVFTDRGLERLPFVSHLRLIRLNEDGYNVESVERLDELMPHNENEVYGIEDARITRIGDTFYVAYVSVSDKIGISTSLMSTTDFKQFTRHGVIFDLETKDVVLFPEKFEGRYAAFIRPMSKTGLHRTTILATFSPDLIHWGEYRYLMNSPQSGWNAHRIGMGCPPLKTKLGWLSVYHGVEKVGGGPAGRYCAGAILTALDNPTRIIGQSSEPFFEPTESFEKNGFVSNVVFPTGIVQDHLNPDKVLIYYGCADTSVGVVTFALPDIINSLEKV